MFYLVMVLPHFSIFCSIDLSNTFLWRDIEICANTFVVESFLENSIWSLLCIILIFDSLHRGIKLLGLNSSPNTTAGKIVQQGKVFLLLCIPLILWQGLSLLLEYFSTSVGQQFEAESLLTSFLKVQVYGLLGFNLNAYLTRRNPLAKRIEVQNGTHKSSLVIEQIQWAEKMGKKYYLFSKEGKFEVAKTLQELEALLPKNTFFRVNRSTIVNITQVATISFWEHEKYILTLKTKKELVMTRKKVLQLKKRLNGNTKLLPPFERKGILKTFPLSRN